MLASCGAKNSNVTMTKEDVVVFSDGKKAILENGDKVKSREYMATGDTVVDIRDWPCP